MPSDLSPDLDRAIQAGMARYTLELGLAEARQPPLPIPPPPIPPPPEEQPMPRRPLWRVVGRRSLRLFRPFAAPFLYRLDLRVRSGVDHSAFAGQTASRLNELDSHAANRHKQAFEQAGQGHDKLVDAVQHLAQALAAHKATLAAVQATLAAVQATLAAVQATAAHSRAEATDHYAHLVRQNDHTHLTSASFQDRMAQHEQAVTASLADLRDDVGHLRQRGAIPLGADDYLVRTASGWLVIPVEDERLLMALVETAGVLEPGTARVIGAILEPGDTMVDVGAHVGTMTLVAARAVGPGGHVVAVEPGSRAVGLLRRGLHLNGVAETVDVHQCAAGAEAGEADLFLSDVLGENSLVAGHGGAGASERVAVRSLDSLVPPGAVALVKIDAEGYELEVLKGMSRIIAENPDLAVIVEFGPTHLARTGTSIADWLAVVQAPGFTPWLIEELTGAVQPLPPQDDLARVFSFNMLLTRQPLARYPRLRTA